ncbi:MAG: N-acetylmuramoyl-L-alanine amidase [Blautia sp.]|nr:N-acetylmuramoyl-L-alanine amidase [Blautia sp.]
MHQGIYEKQIEKGKAQLPMDARILRCITALLGLLTLLVCCCLYYFPGIHARAVLAAENQRQEEILPGELMQTMAPEAVVKEEDLKAQLRVGLPQGLAKEQLELENDYLTQTVYVRFAGGVDDYFAEYGIRGSSDHIASLSYYKDGGTGVIALGLDAVYELEDSYEDGSLYLNFIDPHDIYDKVVVVDAGHGGRAPGAVKNGVSEKNIDLAILLELKELFEKADGNIGVYYTRTSDTNPTLEQRVQLANKSRADLFISIHNNSSASGNFSMTHGTQVMYSQSDKSEFSSRRLAGICLDSMVEALGSRDGGLLKGDDIYIIKNSESPVALIEVGFMTNYEELDKLKSEKYQRKAAKGIYKAIQKAFEEGY